MKKSEQSSGETIELNEINIILKIPADAAKLEITALMLDENNDVVKVVKQLGLEDIHEARRDFLLNVGEDDDYDVRYVLTDEGRAYLKQLEREGKLTEEDDE